MNDVISRQAAVEAIENTDWYHLMDGVMVRGANSNEHQAWYKEQDIYKALEQLPSAQPDSKELSGTHKALDTVSRQAVIEAINKIFPADPMRDDYTQGITCGAALANIYVAQLPSAQPETHDKRTETHGVCLDAIDRQATLDWLKNEWNGMITSLFNGIKALPSAQPEIIPQPQRKKGKWIYGESEAGNDGYYCSKCGNFVPWKYDEYDIDFIKEFLFCNKCGADMTEGEG